MLQVVMREGFLYCPDCCKEFKKASHFEQHYRTCKKRRENERAEARGDVVQRGLVQLKKWDGVYIDQAPPLQGFSRLKNERADTIRRWKFELFMSYAQISAVIADVHHLEDEVRHFGVQNEPVFPDELQNCWWAVRNFGMKEGTLNDKFIDQRLKQLEHGIWVLDLVQALRDLLRLPAVKSNWVPAPLVDADDPDPEEIRSIFDGDAYRKHPLVLEWSKRERENAQGVRQEPQEELIWSRKALIEVYESQVGEGDGEIEWFEAGDEPEEADEYFDADDGEGNWGDWDEESSPRVEEKESRAEDDKFVESLPPETLKEHWVFFGTWNDDGSLADPLRQGSTKALQWAVFPLNLASPLRWAFMWLFCSVTLAHLKKVGGGGVEGGIDLLSQEFVDFLQLLAIGIPMMTAWGPRLVKGALLR
uniref:C2H2-type domain-containing protein n=1 Tax=Chromera velia CCMP2878 TaxID=1169474 RepID=A0A0G4GUB0_9ALVE|eukprot:Cvel_23387.t1-p1 / transcript=Cvel_23387.t1 / gene=Cvel_23387 / organism=Chromera_velia_CCMP2878 / gene_product=hypothetical protein / transcript_product=hypothetical protein / location=Cvel_scaffold2404:4286-6297(+) / protein_length=418 / sequence_SO=supercontig / SO=protein_coding / is_pseudo=false